MGRLVIITGTGTGLGKTHAAEALLLGARAVGRTTLGLKPVESGVVEGVVTDAHRLDTASTFHVKQFGIALPDPVSPHLAARRAGVRIDLPALTAQVQDLRDSADMVLVELPGGLFSPVTDDALNADFAALLAADALLLVAPDRLGVLHDVLAATRAAAALPLAVTGIVLVAPAEPDASTGSNAAELQRLGAPPVFGRLAWEPAAQLARADAVAAILGKLLEPR